MAERIYTLFGEEIIPEQQKAPAKSRAKKKSEEEKPQLPLPELLAVTESLIEAKTKEDEEMQQTIAVEAPVAETFIEETPVTEDIPLTAIEDVFVPEKIEEEAAITDITTTESFAETPAEENPVEEITIVIEPAIVTAPVVETKIDEIPEPAKKALLKQKRALEKEIVLPEEWTGEKQYYTIGEVADLFKVKTSNIRFWTNEFKLKVRTTRKGDRLFTPAQVHELRAIHHLVKERGFTLAGAKAKLKEMNNMVAETVDLKKSLQQLKNKLLAIRNQLV